MGGLIFFVIVLIAMVPKPVWIVLGITIAVTVLGWIAYKGVVAMEQRSHEAEKRKRAQQAAQAAADKRNREERARQEKQRKIDTLGKRNAEHVDRAVVAAQQVASSEAARAGWLGDVNFSADINAVTEDFAKAHALRGVAAKLSALDKPSADDRKILAEANATIAKVESAALDRVSLICKCATEARRIDESMRTERHDARVAEQRAELHATLSAMLYGVEAAPPIDSGNSAVDAVMARVQAYRDIKNQIDLARSNGTQ